MSARRATCSQHPGIIIDKRPCHRCPQPEEVRPVATQQSLTGLMWDAYDVPVVKVTLSGSQDMPMDILSALDLQDLEPGDVVILTVGCTVRRVALDDEDGKKRGLVSFKLGMVRGAQVVREEGEG